MITFQFSLFSFLVQYFHCFLVYSCFYFSVPCFIWFPFMSRLVSSLCPPQCPMYAGSLVSSFCLYVEFYTFHHILPVPHLVFLVVVFGLGLSVSKLYSYFLSCFFCLLFVRFMCLCLCLTVYASSFILIACVSCAFSFASPFSLLLICLCCYRSCLYFPNHTLVCR